MKKMKTEIQKLIEEVEEIIRRNLNQRPVIFERSNFKKDWEELKKKYEGE